MGETPFRVTSSRSPDWDDAEIGRRLSRVYALLLSHRQNRETIDACEAAESTELSAAGDNVLMGRDG